MPGAIGEVWTTVMHVAGLARSVEVAEAVEKGEPPPVPKVVTKL